MVIMRKSSNTEIQGLTEKTAEVFDPISRLKCIKGLYLTGGTGLSLQINHRLSEDLDFELLGIRRERPQLDFAGIIAEVQEMFSDARPEILGDDQFLIFVNGGNVKLSFYRPENPVKTIHDGFVYNNLKTPSLQELLGMKVFTICVRNKFRDYYDIYCLLKEGFLLGDAISYASFLSRHSIKSKTMLSRLLAPQLFVKEKDFSKMAPKFDVTPEQIRDLIVDCITNEKFAKKSFLSYEK